MTDYKNIEKECFEFLKTKFEKVYWLSEISNSPIDFKCIDERGIEFFIEGKYLRNNKVFLSPNQKRADAVVVHNGKDIKLIWKKDFGDVVNFSKTRVMKINKEVKDALDSLKKHPREPYSEVIERLLPTNK